MTTLTIAGLERGPCEQLAQRLRAAARHAAVPVAIRVTTDALDVQRLGTLGACTLLANDRVVARAPWPADVDLERLLVTWAAGAETRDAA